MRKTPSREIAVEMKNGRLLRGKKHFPETKLTQSWAAESASKGANRESGLAKEVI